MSRHQPCQHPNSASTTSSNLTTNHSYTGSITAKGCRAGSQCPFKHLQPTDKVTSTRPKPDHQRADAAQGPSVAQDRQPLSRPVSGSISGPAPSQKPQSQLQRRNPREFELGQVIKRFSPVRRDTSDGTTLSFALAPSDPDFPFELEGGLRCTLTVPTAYPQNGKPTIRVTNAEMARGFQINVEKGFESLVESSPNKTLLVLLNELDKKLEKFLTSEKAQTIKIIANADKIPKVPDFVPEVARPPPSPPKFGAPRPPTWTAEQRSSALAKREADVRQLEARMGRIAHFSKTPDGTTFNIPIHIVKSDRLPLNLQPLKEVTLIVPRLYNLEPCTILLKGVSGSEAENVQLAFERHVRSKLDMTLMAHVNYLTQNIHSMASEVAESGAQMASLDTLGPPEPSVDETQVVASRGEDPAGPKELILDEDKPHVKFIPRPPEWDRQDSEDESDSSYDSGEYSDSADEEQDEEGDTEPGGAALPVSSTSTEKGIHISFPNLELHNIELLTLSSLSISVKCLRCKSPLDISKIKPSGGDAAGSPTSSSVRTETCSKCTTPFTVSYTPNALHANTVRAGTIEVTGCTIADLLPSVFQPTCASCSTTFPVPPGMISVRGDTPIQVCRGCHGKMTFTIHEVKFLRASSAFGMLPARRRPQRENLGISAGTPLPHNGTCAHYRHSYRWFRFSCCQRVHPCDRCHDAAESHVNEHADRMVCGWCSREQRFRAEDCALCGRSVIRRRRTAGAGGFWEGGKGTREKGLMSRKEKRKYKRPGGSVVGSASAAKKDGAK